MINEPDRDSVLLGFIERATAQISVPARTVPRRRRIAVASLLGSAALTIVVIAAALVIGRVISEVRGGVAAPSSATPPVSGAPAREPDTLAQLPWEGAVLDAFRLGGLSVRTIGGSTQEGSL